MAVAVLIELQSCTREQYDEVLEAMGLTFGVAPEHAIFHVAGPTEDGGWRVVDVWDSLDAFDHFAREKIGPCLMSAGIDEEPRITIWDVHNTMSQEGQVHLAFQINS